jgi:uncharacterized protein
MIVVSDTSPITALITVGSFDLLPKLFGEVVIPRAVESELLAEHASLPLGLRIVDVTNLDLVTLYRASVDAGEAEAIQLAKELAADRLLIDDAKGRKLAASEGLAIVGLIGIVLLAKRNGLISSAREVLNRLQQEAGAYVSEELV